MSSQREFTAIDRIAEDYLEAQVAASPVTSTYLGVDGADHLLDDYSMAGVQAKRDLAATTLDRLADASPVDEVDRVTVAAMRERLGVTIDSVDRVLAGQDPVALNVLDSTAQEVRDVFDLMATDTPEQWASIIARLQAVPAALDQHVESLRFSAGHGVFAAKRQVRGVAAQCVDQASEDSPFKVLIDGASEQDASVQADLATAVEVAKAAFGEFAETLTSEFLPIAPEADAVGVDRYQVESRLFLGSTIDLAETYAWGKEELARIDAMMRETAEQIKPGASVKEAIAALNSDERYQLHSTEELQQWMQVKADEAIAELNGSHFDIPEPVRTIECRIAPSQTGIIYYTPPSEDFSRPGSMWWSVPKGVTTFHTWAELTTVYHEGVPGHHLQFGQTAYRTELLNRWRRSGAWVSGHGEGWALYSEWLMADLGYLDDPGDRMGLLDAQALRAVRVVIDIGVHCGFEAPDEVGGGDFTYDKAWQILDTYTNMEEKQARFELDRYMGYPGQAPSYKIGERLWLELRDELRAKQGDSFDLKAFHRSALDLGGLGLDTLRAAVLGQI